MSVSGGGVLDAAAADGEMAARVRAFDWSRTPLGPAREWPRSLSTLVDLLPSQPIPTIVLWGPELTQIYNGAYAVIAASKHPAALGRPNRECWPEALALTEPIYRRVLDAGERVLLDDQPIPLDRRGLGKLEDAYFTVSYSPARGDDGRIGGIFVTVIETTDRRAAERAREERLLGEQLRRGYETFYHLVQNDPSGVYVVDADFRLAEVSRGARKVFANVPRPLLGRDFAGVLRVVWPEPFASEAIGRFRHTLGTGEPYAAPATVERRADVPDVATYRRMKRTLTEEERAGAGAFRDSATVDEGWRATAACAATLGASSVLFQCPASFRPTADNVKNMESFFRRVERPAGVRLLWEPRGPWAADVVKGLCDALDLVHVVDPFVNETVTRGVTYFRLHGITGSRHVYSDEELKRLRDLLPAEGEAYVMFNNIPRAGDAVRFGGLLGSDLVPAPLA